MSPETGTPKWREHHRDDDYPSPAQLLVGRTLTNGWVVEKLVDDRPDSTGGHFSTSYVVRSPDGREAFLKAMDYRRALSAPDPARELQTMTAAYNHEREVLAHCRANDLTRIVRVLDDGTVPPGDGDPSGVVQYLIFELARGDIRSVVSFAKALDHAWLLRTIHQSAAALRQLHSVQMAHQDLKPSNILVFSQDQYKLADLGRSYHRHITSPTDDYDVPGDSTYAPPELLYGHLHPDWKVRRIAGDLYLLGSLIVYLYSGVAITHLLLNRIDSTHHYLCGATYSDVLPYLQHEFAQILREFSEMVPPNVSTDITAAVSQLSNLQPEKRGHPRNAIYKGGRYSLERYVSLFDRLARTAEWSLKHIVLRGEWSANGRV